MEYIDLHTHSSASDGSDAPALLVEKARRSGLAALALTDHDTISGLDEAMKAGRVLGQTVIPGCELSTMSEYGSMHILGLWVTPGNAKFEAWLEHFRDLRQKRNAKIIWKLRQMGVDISLEEVTRRATGSVGRPHIAGLLLDKGYVASRAEAFDMYIGENAPAYVPKTPLSPEEATTCLNGLGATVVLAHPLLRNVPMEWLEGFVVRLRNVGLSALEVWHSSNTPEQSRLLIGLANKYNLGLSGGSDYHGSNKDGVELGSGRDNNVRVPLDILNKLMEMRRSRGLKC